MDEGTALRLAEALRRGYNKGFGDTVKNPIGIDPDGDVRRFLHDQGIYGHGPLQRLNELLITGTSQGADAALRGIHGGVRASTAYMGQLANELTGTNPKRVERTANAVIDPTLLMLGAAGPLRFGPRVAPEASTVKRYAPRPFASTVPRLGDSPGANSASPAATMARYNAAVSPQRSVFPMSQPRTATVLERDVTGRPTKRAPMGNLEQKTDRLLEAITSKANEPAPIWRSTLRDNVEQLPEWTATGEQWLNRIKKNGGIRAEELEWTGLEAALKASGANKLSREDVLAAIRPLDVTETVLQGQSSKLTSPVEVTEVYVTDAEEAGQLRTSDNTFPIAGNPQFGYADEVWAMHDANGDTSWEIYHNVADDQWYTFDPTGAFENNQPTLQHAIDEVMDVDIEMFGPGAGGTQYEAYTLPGGENYREVLLTLPSQRLTFEEGAAKFREHGIALIGYGGDDLGTYNGYRLKKWGADDLPENRINPNTLSVELQEIFNKLMEKDYQSGHFSEPNVLVHLRTKDRTTVDGEPTLFIEEIQSDWHQRGRERGYNIPLTEAEKAEYKRLGSLSDRALDTLEPADREMLVSERFNELENRVLGEGVPNAPFKKSWPELALKRALRMAVDEGKDRVAWTTGQQQAERYNLNKQISHLALGEEPGGTYTLQAYRRDNVYGQQNSDFMERGVTFERLQELVGKETAEKLMAAQNNDGWRSLKGQDLEMGGEGMKGFYDKILVRVANKLVKQYGAKVETTRVPSADSDAIEVHSIKLNSTLKTAIKRGLPLFSMIPILGAFDEESNYAP